MVKRDTETELEEPMTNADPRPIVLVPGACLGGWIWSEVAKRLRAEGHEVCSVTLTGLGERVHLAHENIDLETHIADVVNVLDYNDLHDAILVGHSYAGVVITGVADRRPQRLNAVVYLDTGPFASGMAIIDVQSPAQLEQQRQEVQANGDGWRWPVPSRDTLTTGAFGSVSGLTEEHFRLIAQRGTPQPYGTFTSKLRLEDEKAHGLRHVAVFCSAGGTSLEHLRDLIAQSDPRAMLFADPGWELHELPTGHWAMLSSPDPLAGLLHQIALHQSPQSLER
jgi:pimeloyl-ACP methyl ester carboxylesterase